MIKAKKLAVAVALIVGASVAAVAIPGIAQAALPCASMRICTFEDTWLLTNQYDWNGPTNTGCHYVGAPKDNKIKGVRQAPDLPGVVSWYPSNNCRGGVIASTGINQLRSCNNYWPYWNDFASPCSFVFIDGLPHSPQVSSFWYSG